MKNFFFIFFPILFGVFFLVPKTNAQQYDVYLEPIGEIQNITSPVTDIVLAEYDVIITDTQSYRLDSCWLVIQGVLPEVITNVRYNRSDHPEDDPYTSWSEITSDHFLTLGEVFNFPPISDDTTRIIFVADIGIETPPIVGSTIIPSLYCRCFSLAGEETVTNTAFAPHIFVSSVNGIEEIVNQVVPARGGVGRIFVYEYPLWIFDGSGRMILIAEESGIYPITQGYYLWGRKIGDSISYGSLLVR